MSTKTLLLQSPMPAAHARTLRQLPPVGPIPDAAQVLIGSLLYSTVGEVLDITKHVSVVDLDEPAATMFRIASDLAEKGAAPGPQLVIGELRRQGLLNEARSAWLLSATVSGASPYAARHFAADVVALSLRREVDSYGRAFASAAESGPESLLDDLADRAAEQIRSTAVRLRALRGDAG